MQAYADCGIRAAVALDQPELPESEKLPYLAELADADLRAELAQPPGMDAEGLLAAYDHLISRWHGAEGGRLTAAVSISAPQRVSVEYFGAIDELSRRHGLPLFAHMLETKTQRVLAGEQPRFGGRSLVRYTADLGLLSERMNVIHAVWVDDADLDLIAEAGAVIAHNPISNLRLGSGVMPFRRIADRGIPICLGVDEAICDDSVNMWPVVKTAGLIHNVSGLESDLWPTAAEVLGCLWDGGARAMGRQDDLGAVEEGAHRRPDAARPEHAALHAAERRAQATRLLPQRRVGRADDGRRPDRLRGRPRDDGRRAGAARRGAGALRAAARACAPRPTATSSARCPPIERWSSARAPPTSA